MVVHDLINFNPNTRIRDPKLKMEADLVEQVAQVVKDGKLKAVMQMEAEFESWGLPNMMGGGRFYGAPLEFVDAPIKYSRILLGAGFDAEDLQSRFLAGIKHRRFIELQKVTGAFQGRGKHCLNQLLDAFHIWCAEHNSCDYFLTLDFRLVRMVSGHKLRPTSPILVRPSELLAAIGG
jgi:hypothetical protein